jgi:hypothetical protein
MILQIASIALALAAFADGLSTVHFLRKSDTEQNFLFGPHPSTVRIFAEGAGLIGAEIITAFVIGHYSTDISYAIGCLLMVQAAAHVIFAVKNFKL